MRVGGWWIMAQVDGATRIDGFYDADGDGDDDISWVPSVGWEFNSSDWPESKDESNWRVFRIRALQDDEDTEDQTVTFSHEVWDSRRLLPRRAAPRPSPRRNRAHNGRRRVGERSGAVDRGRGAGGRGSDGGLRDGRRHGG